MLIKIQGQIINIAHITNVERDENPDEPPVTHIYFVDGRKKTYDGREGDELWVWLSLQICDLDEKIEMDRKRYEVRNDLDIPF